MLGCQWAKSTISGDSAHLGLPGGTVVKNSPACAGDMGLIPGLGRSPGEGNSNPLQYTCLKNSMNKGAWWTTVHGVAQLETTERLILYFAQWMLGKHLTYELGSMSTCFPGALPLWDQSWFDSPEVLLFFLECDGRFPLHWHFLINFLIGV